VNTSVPRRGDGVAAVTRVSLLAVCGAVGCLLPGGDSAVLNPELSPPEIDDIDLVCDVDKGLWTIELVVSAWTGGAELMWTTDAEYVEIHSFQSISAGPKGKREVLILEMSSAVDWRVGGNGATAFSCASTPSVLVTVFDLDREISDCARFGYRPDLVETLNVSSCDQVWDSLVID